MLIRMLETGAMDSAFDPASRLEGILKRAKAQAQELGEKVADSGPRVLLGPDGNGLAAAAGRRIDFDDPLARECFIDTLADTATGSTPEGQPMHALDPDRVAALLGMI